METPFSMIDKHVLVVGANGGIGREVARMLAGIGAGLWLADRVAPESLAAELRATGFAVEAFACDVAIRSEIEAMIGQCEPLHAVVYTAAICPWDDWEAPGWDETFDEVIKINVKGALDVSRAAMSRMSVTGGGNIVLVSSLAGRNGGLIASPHYVASKGGINALVKWLARRGAPHGVLVNGIAPASVRTPMMEGQEVDVAKIPLRRMAEPWEVAAPIAFLCTPAASYMTGTILDVNGGIFMG